MFRAASRLCLSLGGALATLLSVGVARADRVVLIGQTVLEGKVTQAEGRVTIETAAGTVSVPVEAVARVEESASPIEHFEERYAVLGPREVRGRMVLANYCRDHGLNRQEQRLLEEVITLSPDHAVARARLGYVRDGSGWMTLAESMRRKGLVFHEGRWIPKRQFEHLMAAAALERQAARLEAARRELLLEEARRDAERIRQEARREREAVVAEREALERRERGAWGTIASSWVSYPLSITAARLVSPGLAAGPWKRRKRMRRSAAPSDTSLSVVKVPYATSVAPRRP